MASVIYRVNSQDLRDVATQLRGKNREFRTKVQELVSTESRLHGQWEGESHEIFHGEFNKDKGQFEVFANGIDQYVNALEEAARQYEIAEDRSRQLARENKA